MTEQYLDGNALAGPLREIFAVDITAALQRCAHCGNTGPVAVLRVYHRAPGLVARCPGCDEVVLRLVRGPTDAWLDLTGTLSLRIALPRVPEPARTSGSSGDS
ncbi:MAG: DUF6510 family protein [Actinomycetota bacterium]|nr:DUF6510 family protein [Actinomycetota bacterium]